MNVSGKYLLVLGILSCVCISWNRLFYDNDVSKCYGMVCENGATLNNNTCKCLCGDNFTGPFCETVTRTTRFPRGVYALPATLHGCPEDERMFGWTTGFINLTLTGAANLGSRHYWSEDSHLLGPYHKRTVQMNFCIRRDKDQHTSYEWPPGNYCVYKLEYKCPKGFAKGTITLEDNAITTGQYDGHIPMVTSSDVTLTFCCRQDNEGIEDIEFGNQLSDFYLFKPFESASCQNILDMELMEEEFSFRKSSNTTWTTAGATPSFSEDDLFFNITFCYYQAKERKECMYSMDLGASYRGTHNTTTDGPCEMWQDVPVLDTRYKGDFEDNFCRTLHNSTQGPVCYVNGTLTSCGSIPLCEDDISIESTNHALLKPVKSSEGIPHDPSGNPINERAQFKDQQIVVNGRSSLINFKITTPCAEPYFSVDLGFSHDVEAVYIYRAIYNEVEPESFWERMVVWVSEREWDFVTFGAYMCGHMVDAYKSDRMLFRCDRPIRGRYVTIQTNVHSDPDVAADDHLNLQVSEIAVYGEATICGRNLGLSTGKIERAQVTVSNSGVKYIDTGDFSSIDGWCPPGRATQPAANVETVLPMLIQGVRIQVYPTNTKGTTDNTTRSNAIQFVVFYGFEYEKDSYKYYKDFERNIQIFQLSDEPGFQDGQLFLFSNPFVASVVGIEYQEHNISVCYKLEFIVCERPVSMETTGIQKRVGWMKTSDRDFARDVGILKVWRNKSWRECFKLCKDQECNAFSHSISSDRCSLTNTASYPPFQTLTLISKDSEREITITERIWIKEQPILNCNLKMTKESMIFSPKYPQLYTDHMNCKWEFDIPNAAALVVDIIDFDIRPWSTSINVIGATVVKREVCFDDVAMVTEDDRLVITERYEDTDIIIRTRGSFQVAGNHVQITFRSCEIEQNTENRGFALRIRTLDCPVCPREEFRNWCNEVCGYVQSSYFPSGMYEIWDEDNLRPNYELQGEFYQYVKLVFLYFDLPADAKVVIKEYSGLGELEQRHQLTRAPYAIWHLSVPQVRLTQSFIYSPDHIGFQIKYIFQTSTTFESVRIPFQQQPCQEGWMFFEGHCYYMVKFSPGTFLDARRACIKLGSDLAKITSMKESNAVHLYLMSQRSSLTQDIVVIGLTSIAKHRIYRWLDGSRAIFQNWDVKWTWRDYGRINQQYMTVDGCVVIHIVTTRNSANWYNRQCRSDYEFALCEKSIYEDKRKLTSRSDIEVTDTSDITDKIMFECSNLEMIDIASQCDGIPDCEDKSDEIFCNNGTDGVTCSEDQYECYDQRQCIPISRYCDFVPDCNDQTDELYCEHPACEKSEFRCQNGQCIDYPQRCDLKPDCIDGSDERDCQHVDCSTHDNLFQCKNQCIPKSLVCDGFVDCQGWSKSDEESCGIKLSRKTCQEWYADGFRQSGTYYINLGIDEDDFEAYRVECEFDEKEGVVSTVFHHTHQAFIPSTDGNEERSMQYDFKIAKFDLEMLESYGMECRQRLDVECYHTTDIKSTVRIVGGKDMNICKVYSTCEDQYSIPLCGNLTRCNCSLTDDDWLKAPRTDWYKDVFYIDNGDFLPIKRIHSIGASGPYSNTRLAVGPLVCYASMPTQDKKIKCNTGTSISIDQQCLYNIDKYGYATGCRDNTHLLNCEKWKCPSGYAKCPGDFCIPLEFICDGKMDCRFGEDEMDCKTWVCPNLFRCRNSTKCIPKVKLCNGLRDCQFGDDEANCEHTCPATCLCTPGLADCSGANLNKFVFTGLSEDIRTLVLNSTNPYFAGISPFERFTYLGKLYLSSCNIDYLSDKTFRKLKNLFFLDLSYNRITTISTVLFRDLSNLRFLNLIGNKALYFIQANAFINLKRLPILDLHGMSITHIPEGMLRGLTSLELLNLSGNALSVAADYSFSSLQNLRALDISGNKISSFGDGLFAGLERLDYLISDSFLFCCIKPTNLSLSQCLPSPDVFSSCSDLLRSGIVRACLWCIGSLAFFGNILSFIFRLMSERGTLQSGYGVLVTNLTVADMIMGLYLLIISAVDSLFRGRYIWNDYSWRHSFGCAFAGILGMLSAECSVLILMLITFDRFKSIKYNSGFTKSMSLTLGMFAWSLSIFVAVLPVLPVGPFADYFGDSFYSVSGVCLTLPLTSTNIQGLGYSAAILIVFNFVCFVAIAIGQTVVYLTIRRTKLMLECPDRRIEFQIARRLSAVVVTDFVAWFPICVLGIHTLMGGEVSGLVYTWIAVFVLPFNSALNPIIYTYSSFSNSELGRQIMERLGIQTARFSTKSEVSVYKNRVHAMYRSRGVTMCPHKYHIQVRNVFAVDSVIGLKTVFDISYHMVTVIDELHAANLALSKFKEDHITVLFGNDKEVVQVIVRGLPRPSQSEADKTANILDTGRVVAWMLKRFNIQKRRHQQILG